MNRRTKGSLPTKLVEAQQEFERWRSEHAPGTHLPEGLWSVAADLAREFGISPTASALRLNYSGLKRRLEPPQAQGPSAPEARNPFLELLPLPTPSASECIIECQDGSGAQIRIQLTGVAVSDVADLCGRLWSRAR